MLTLALATALAGHSAPVGTWYRCDDRTCTRFSGVGFFVQDDGMFHRLKTEPESVGTPENTYCVERSGTWDFRGQNFTIYNSLGDVMALRITMGKDRMEVVDLATGKPAFYLRGEGASRGRCALLERAQTATGVEAEEASGAADAVK